MNSPAGLELKCIQKRIAHAAHVPDFIVSSGHLLPDQRDRPIGIGNSDDVCDRFGIAAILLYSNEASGAHFQLKHCFVCSDDRYTTTAILWLRALERSNGTEKLVTAGQLHAWALCYTVYI